MKETTGPIVCIKCLKILDKIPSVEYFGVVCDNCRKQLEADKAALIEALTKITDYAKTIDEADQIADEALEYIKKMGKLIVDLFSSDAMLQFEFLLFLSGFYWALLMYLFTKYWTL